MTSAVPSEGSSDLVDIDETDKLNDHHHLSPSEFLLKGIGDIEMQLRCNSDVVAL